MANVIDTTCDIPFYRKRSYIVRRTALWSLPIARVQEAWMAKRMGVEQVSKLVLASPGLKNAPVLDLMCSHFVLTLAARLGSNFNVRRDLNSVVSLAGRHLVWPLPVLARVREFLAR